MSGLFRVSTGAFGGKSVKTSFTDVCFRHLWNLYRLQVGFGGLCSQKWHIMLAVLEILPNYAKIMPEFPNYASDFRNYAHKMT